MIKSKITLLIGSLFLLPQTTLGQGTGVTFTNIDNLVTGISNVISILIPVAFAAILLFFFWGLAKYMLGDAEDKEKGKNLMIWGVIALFVAASIWGLVAFLRDVFGVNDLDQTNNPVAVPQRGIQ